ncbi:MAG TPA: FAD-binding oxidoreductase [Longimicrobiaceae bacterium]|nr:FAD-binding oxidoreductase [Longimicrobiaceae bacterium]
MIPSSVQRLSGWGRHPVQSCRVYRPEKVAELRELLGSPPEGGLVSRGLGRAYGDAALNARGGVVSHLRLNRMLAFDPATGVLECEGGVSFAEIVDAFLPRGWFLPVTPGTREVTVGGAVACDVHGKNHHRDGTLARFVEGFRLLTPARGAVDCSRAADAELFRATLGGMGLTGAVLRARLRLLPVESAWMTVDYSRTADLDGALERFAADDAGYRYSVAWIDCLARGRSLGRGVLMRGDHAPAARVRGEPFAGRPAARARVPLDAPSALLNRLTVGAFNRLYHALHRDRAGVLVPIDRFFYPLDGVRDWNRLYGRRGLVQHQSVVPFVRGDALARMLERVAAAGRGSFLAVLKRFGPAGEGVLSFPAEGHTLALDFPVAAGLAELLRELDRIVLDAGGRVYLAKDASLNAATFAAMYPAAGRFRAVKAEVDPEGVLSSSLARRVGLVDA